MHVVPVALVQVQESVTIIVGIRKLKTVQVQDLHAVVGAVGRDASVPLVDNTAQILVAIQIHVHVRQRVVVAVGLVGVPVVQHVTGLNTEPVAVHAKIKLVMLGLPLAQVLAQLKLVLIVQI